ncbi:MAG: hypothetical protein AAFQ58_08930 [Pseudomonadota bacterium]
MTTQDTADLPVALIVTTSFVEAEDISDALRHYDLGEVSHVRDSRAALDRLADGAAAPSLALIAFDRNDTEFPFLLNRLHAARTRIVLINGHPELAQEFGTTFLLRPFSNSDLDTRIAEAMSRV